jgi:hypothetical protein
MNVESVFLFLFFMGKESRSEAKGSGVWRNVNVHKYGNTSWQTREKIKCYYCINSVFTYSMNYAQHILIKELYVPNLTF